MTDSTPGREQDRQLLAAAPESSDDWDDATWAAWARTADRAHADRASAVRADRDAAVAAAASHTLAKMTELRDRLKAMNDPARSGVSLAIHLVRALTDDTAETPAREQDYDVVKRVLTELNVAWIDPHCGHPRSPDTEFMSPCPDPDHDTA